MAAGAPVLWGEHATDQVERPLITYRDDATGERTELSAAALGGWASRTAALLRERCGLGAGARVAVLLPPHWQTAAVLLGAWSAGLSVSFRPWATAGLPVADPRAGGPFDAVFVSRERAESWLEEVPPATHRFLLGLAPNGGTLDAVPDGYLDFMAEVGSYPDSLPAPTPIPGTAPASVDGTTFRQWGSLAHDVATSLDLRAGDRVLVDTARHEHPYAWLLAPLSVGATVVLCANLDPATADTRAAAEHATRVL